MSVSKLQDEYIIDCSEKKLLDGLVCSIVLFVHFIAVECWRRMSAIRGPVTPAGMTGSMLGLVGATNVVVLSVL